MQSNIKYIVKHEDYLPITTDELYKKLNDKPIKFSREALKSIAADITYLDMSDKELADYLQLNSIFNNGNKELSKLRYAEELSSDDDLNQNFDDTDL